MNINFAPYKKILSDFAFTDRIDVYRKQSVTDIYGATRNDNEVIVLTKENAKISFSEIDSPGDESESNIPISRKVKIFTNLELEILSGDIIVGYRDEIELVKGIANDANKYETHQEITILEEGYN